MQNQKYNRLMKKSFLDLISNHLYSYPTPINISYLWSFGALAGICLVIQIVTGIFLAMHYTPNTAYAFVSVEHIMRDVNNGWFLRLLHANGASFFFLTVYCHIFRGLYYSSYTFPRTHLWCSGVIIFILMMATAFIGYVLPWGQMSFWGATVITNLFSALPIVGESVVQWLWGGFSVDNATLNRFFSLHYLLPFVIIALVFIHLILLHNNGSTNPTGIDNKFNKVPFYPYFYIKDLFSLILFFIVLFYFVYFNPNALGHPDNYIKANPLVTPAHIVPEWYFLPFYAILRSIPDKLGGVVAMALSLIVLLLLPVINMGNKRTVLFRPIVKLNFWSIFTTFLILGWIGQKEVETPYIEVGQVATLFYFDYFLIFIPLYNLFENIIFEKSTNYEKITLFFHNLYSKKDVIFLNINIIILIIVFFNINFCCGYDDFIIKLKFFFLLSLPIIIFNFYVINYKLHDFKNIYLYMNFFISIINLSLLNHENIFSFLLNLILIYYAPFFYNKLYLYFVIIAMELLVMFVFIIKPDILITIYENFVPLLAPTTNKGLILGILGVFFSGATWTSSKIIVNNNKSRNKMDLERERHSNIMELENLKARNAAGTVFNRNLPVPVIEETQLKDDPYVE